MRLLPESLLTSSRAMFASFIAAIFVGAAALSLPGMCVGEPLSAIDALFTATSAVCVTGLVVVDTATHFTRRGQWVLLALMQMGGLGILTFTTWALMMGGGRMASRERGWVIASVGSLRGLSWRRVLRNVLLFTFAFEALGAGALMWRWRVAEVAPNDIGFQSLFHAVSAFCNAGFSTLPGGLTASAVDPVVTLVVAALLIVGGLGFLVLTDLTGRVLARGDARRRLTLHTRVVLATSLALLLGATLSIAALEWRHSLASLTWPEKLLAAFFQSATPRTAGFNTLPIGGLTSATLFIVMLLMVVGASPGSTGGGVKTTTLAILLALARARASGRTSAELMRRRIPVANVAQALTTLTLYVLALAVGVVAVCFIQESGRTVVEGHHQFQPILFECISALSTVGLSMDYTERLEPLSRLIVAALMLCGRLGPISVALALVGRSRARRYAYPEEPVMTG